MSIETPLIYTTKGNIPIEGLRYETAWEDTDTYLKFTENHYLGEELVKSSAHVYVKKPLECFGQQESF